MTSLKHEYDIFLSYHRADDEWTKRFVDALSKQGMEVWYDEIIKAGETWREKLEEGLRQSRNIVFVVTPETARSNWMALELGAALALKKHLIPIVAEDTPLKDIPGPIRIRKSLVKGDPVAVAERIVRELASERETKLEGAVQ
jgi:hypothetical protein